MGARLLWVGVVVLCLWQGAFAAQSIVTDLRFARLEAELTFWGGERYQPSAATRAATDRGIGQLLAANPTNADYPVLRATQQAWEAWWAGETQARAAHEGQVIAAYRQSLQWRPAHAQTWQMMLEYARSVGDSTAAATAQHHLARIQRPTP